jgi:homoprotocatechuate degradation regulator HpaR
MPMASPIPRKDLPLLLAHARDAVVAGFRPVFQRFGLTEQQWRIVRTLADHGSLEPRELAAICRISKPSLTGVLVRMESAGLVSRERVELDQRRLLFSLTAAGDELLARAAPLITHQYEALERALGADRFATVCGVLDQLAALAGRHNTDVAAKSGRRSRPPHRGASARR